MRRKDREMNEAFALDVLQRAPYVTVSFVAPNGEPYALPLSLAMKDAHTFYFHCALEGKKLECIQASPKVFLSAVTRCKPTVGPKDGQFTLEFKSATASGLAEIVNDPQEKVEGLRLISERFLPHHMNAFDAAVAHSIERTAVVRITLTAPAIGKRKEYDAEGIEKKFGRE